MCIDQKHLFDEPIRALAAVFVNYMRILTFLKTSTNAFMKLSFFPALTRLTISRLILFDIDGVFAD